MKVKTVSELCSYFGIPKKRIEVLLGIKIPSETPINESYIRIAENLKIEKENKKYLRKRRRIRYVHAGKKKKGRPKLIFTPQGGKVK